MFEQAFTDIGVVYKNVSTQLHSRAGEQWAFSFNFFPLSLFSISSFDHLPSLKRLEADLRTSSLTFYGIQNFWTMLPAQLSNYDLLNDLYLCLDAINENSSPSVLDFSSICAIVFLEPIVINCWKWFFNSISQLLFHVRAKPVITWSGAITIRASLKISCTKIGHREKKIEKPGKPTRQCFRALQKSHVETESAFAMDV